LSFASDLRVSIGSKFNFIFFIVEENAIAIVFGRYKRLSNLGLGLSL